MDVDSVHGQKYFMTIVGAHSGYVAMGPIEFNAQATDKVWCFVKYFENQNEHTVVACIQKKKSVQNCYRRTEKRGCILGGDYATKSIFY